MGCKGQRALSSVHSQYFDIKLELPFMKYGVFTYKCDIDKIILVKICVNIWLGDKFKEKTTKERKFYTGTDLQVSGGMVQQASERYYLNHCFDDEKAVTSNCPIGV